jgi:tetratricopeptide (TPR) repeat protein
LLQILLAKATAELIIRFGILSSGAIELQLKCTERLTRHAEALLPVILALAVGLFVQPVSAQQHNYTKTIVDDLAHAQICLENGELDQAKKGFLSIIIRDPQCPEAQTGLGRSYLREGNYVLAEGPLKKALALQPGNANLLNDLGNAAYRQEHYADAISYFKQALDHAGNDAYKVHVNLANALSDAHQLDEAIKHFAAAISLKNDYAPAYNGLAKMYYDNGRYEQAIQQAKEAIARKPDYAMAYYHLGVALAAENKIDEARSAFEQSVKYEKNPQYGADTRRILAKLNAPRAAMPASAIKVLDSDNYLPATPADIDKLLTNRQWAIAEKAIEAEMQQGGDKDPMLWNNLGYSLMHQAGGYPRAKKAFGRAISLKNGNFATANYNLGQLLRLMNDSDGAEVALKRAIENARVGGTTFPLAQNALGLVLKQRGDFKSAESAYKRAIMQSGVDLPVAHYNLAIVLEKTDKTRQAVLEYKAYLRLAPGGLNVKQAQARLSRLLGSEQS